MEVAGAKRGLREVEWRGGLMGRFLPVVEMRFLPSVEMTCGACPERSEGRRNEVSPFGRNDMWSVLRFGGEMRFLPSVEIKFLPVVEMT